MEKEGKISFNLSPTSLNTYYESPLLFYLKYIAKVPDDTQVPVCYGLSGSIIHDCLEKYAKGELDKDNIYLHFAEQWIQKNLDKHRDIKNQVLPQEEYIKALMNGISIVDEHENHICEEKISFPFFENEFMKIGIKGILDLQTNHKADNQKVLIDYKTSNSVSQNDDFKRQALFYNYLLHKNNSQVPDKTVFHYLKLMIPKEYCFSRSEILGFEDELNNVVREIVGYGDDIHKYPIGNIDGIFNSKKEACKKEVIQRQGFLNPKIFVQMKF